MLQALTLRGNELFNKARKSFANIHFSNAYIPGPLSSSLRSRQEKRAFASHLPIHIGSRSRFARDPQALPALLPSNRLASSQRCPGAFSTTTKPSNRLASSQRCSGASSTTHLNCLIVSSWEPVGCLQAPATDCLGIEKSRMGLLTGKGREAHK